MSDRVLHAPGLLAALRALAEAALRAHGASGDASASASIASIARTPEARTALTALAAWLETQCFVPDPVGAVATSPDRALADSRRMHSADGPIAGLCAGAIADAGATSSGGRPPALAIPVCFEAGLREVTMRAAGAVSPAEWTHLRDALHDADPTAPMPAIERRAGLWVLPLERAARAVGDGDGEAGDRLDDAAEVAAWIQPTPDPLAIEDGVVLGAGLRERATLRPWLRWTTSTQMAWRSHPVNRARVAEGRRPVEGWVFWAPSDPGLFDVAGYGLVDAPAAVARGRRKSGDAPLLADDVASATRDLLEYRRLVTQALAVRGVAERGASDGHVALDDVFVRVAHRADPMPALLLWPERLSVWARRLGGAVDVIDRPAVLGVPARSNGPASGRLTRADGWSARAVALLRGVSMRRTRDPLQRCAVAVQRLLAFEPGSG